jgi:hypothetical protein
MSEKSGFPNQLRRLSLREVFIVFVNYHVSWLGSKTLMVEHNMKKRQDRLNNEIKNVL